MPSKLIYSVNKHKAYGDISNEVGRVQGVLNFNTGYQGSAKVVILTVNDTDVNTVKKVVRNKHGYKFVAQTRD
jgi:hypothetical protein